SLRRLLFLARSDITEYPLLYGCFSQSPLPSSPLEELSVHLGQRQPGGSEICFKVGPERRPVSVDDGEPGGIPVLPLHEHVLAKHAFRPEPQPPRRPLALFVRVIALPLHPPVAQVIKQRAQQQERRFCVDLGLLRQLAVPDVAQLGPPPLRPVSPATQQAHL